MSRNSISFLLSVYACLVPYVPYSMVLLFPPLRCMMHGVPRPSRAYVLTFLLSTEYRTEVYPPLWYGVRVAREQRQRTQSLYVRSCVRTEKQGVTACQPQQLLSSCPSSYFYIDSEDVYHYVLAYYPRAGGSVLDPWTAVSALHT